MMSPLNTQKLLLFSCISALLLALLGLILGLWLDSLVILFDGAYSLVSVLLTAISLLTAAYLNSPSSRRRALLSQRLPAIVIAFKGFVIALMCSVSFISALLAMMDGGRTINTAAALLFGVINLLACIGAYTVIKAQASASALVIAETKQWFMDAVISAAVIAGFFIAALLTYFDLSVYAAYADPIMVIVASVYFIVVPVKMMLAALKQLQTCPVQHSYCSCELD
ncbi:cation transporter [Pseudoalteromonas ruthenica]|uniref:Cation transporter n=1 Tax=Pseudoalteromonas ruthenica TaxID=151081 RepID=A0A5S3YZQ6_9GAMM|nr:cation transporter [Pseudoalteromonas ruthenica]TMP85509.1 cation transporter [Pseudoalteromonas ruthenica]